MAYGGIKAFRARAGGTPARIVNVQPIPGMRWLNHESQALSVLIADGTSPLATNSVTLVVDGQTNAPPSFSSYRALLV